MPAWTEIGRTPKLLSAGVIFLSGSVALGGALKIESGQPNKADAKVHVADLPNVDLSASLGKLCNLSIGLSANHCPAKPVAAYQASNVNPIVLEAKLCSLDSDTTYSQCLEQIKELQQVHIEAVSPPVPITDANSTNTWDWSCIRKHEGVYNDYSGAYGIKETTWKGYLPSQGFNEANNYPNPGAAPAWVQDQAALFIFAKNGYHFKGSWNDGFTESGIC